MGLIFLSIAQNLAYLPTEQEDLLFLSRNLLSENLMYSTDIGQKSDQSRPEPDIYLRTHCLCLMICVIWYEVALINVQKHRVVLQRQPLNHPAEAKCLL